MNMSGQHISQSTAKLSTKRLLSDGLSDHEGPLLAAVSRFQPITAYGVAKLFAASPASGFNESMGQVYPAIRRFADQGFITGKREADDARRTTKWECTEKGELALKDWIRESRPAHMVLIDPLHEKVLLFGLMSHQERIDWIIQAKSELMDKVSTIEESRKDAPRAFEDLVDDGRITSIRARMDWLDRIFFELAKGEIREDQHMAHQSITG